MSDLVPPLDWRRLLVVAPSWVGDTVMATPTLRALRQLAPDARITVLGRPGVKDLLDACPWVDRLITVRKQRAGGAAGLDGVYRLARRLGAAHFDAVVLLPNSFRWALATWLARIPIRIGYTRDGRGLMLTDRLAPQRHGGRFTPIPTRDAYLAVARYLGAWQPDPTLALFTRPRDDRFVDDQLARLTPWRDRPGVPPLVMLVPGAAFGDSKMWPVDRFARVADHLHQTCQATLIASGSPREAPLLEALTHQASAPIFRTDRMGLDLRRLKSLVRRASLMITGDTGPRHIAAALGVPVVTLFGPTNPVWAEIGFHREIQLNAGVHCHPCQRKVCPLAGTPEANQCMLGITPEAVALACESILSPSGHAPAVNGRPARVQAST